LKSTLGRFGIDAGVQVIAYDQDTGMYASRLWWLLRWMGHMAVAVLDGGFSKWTTEQRATQSGT
jgi:thiosulfate/3-mercaptopyruvate sulfurtransferase